jgi:RimJ/RimL family protein N-acetyltransferase
MRGRGRLDDMSHPDPWPLRELVLRTPRLELRPDDDEGLRELAEVAYGGIHPPEVMPFSEPWTDAQPEYLGRGTLQYHWRVRAALAPGSWSVNFLVRSAGRVVGEQTLMADGFAIGREVRTGSWLGRRFQGRGYGTEMRAAVLGLAFDHLGARTARSGAFADNAASLAVSVKLGYQPDGVATHVVRDQRVTELRMLLSAEQFAARRPPWRLEVAGLTGCLRLLGVDWAGC